MSTEIRSMLPVAVDSVDHRGEPEMLNWAVLAQSKAAAALSRTDDRNSLLTGICQSIVEQYPYVLACLSFARPEGEKPVTVVANEGLSSECAGELQQSWAAANGPIGICLHMGVTGNFSYFSIDAGLDPLQQQAHACGLRSAVVVPIIDQTHTPVAALAVFAVTHDAFGVNELLLFESLAKVVGAGLQKLAQQEVLAHAIELREEAQQSLADSLRATIEAMSETLEWRDPYSAGHHRRVARIAVAIAKELQWDSHNTEGLYLSALIHDIGKVGVPSEILSKPAFLGGFEMKLVQEHAEIGHQILNEIVFPWAIAEIVRQHHERMDGSGYPRGLTSSQILDEAKILGVADTIEAMASHRPYRSALGLDVAIETLRRGSGSLYDPAVVEAVCSLMDKGNTLQSILDK